MVQILMQRLILSITVRPELLPFVLSLSKEALRLCSGEPCRRESFDFAQESLVEGQLVKQPRRKRTGY